MKLRDHQAGRDLLTQTMLHDEDELIMLGEGNNCALCPSMVPSGTDTCGDGYIFTGLAGAVFMTGLDKHVVLLLAVELWHAAATSRGVARVHVSIVSNSNNMVGFSHRRGAPGHPRTGVPAGSVNHHSSGWTWLCKNKNFQLNLIS